MKQPTQNEPQLKSWFEQNYLDGDTIQKGQTLSSEECFDAIATALEEQRATERTKTIKEMLELVKGMLSGQKIDNGHDCYERFCDYCENNIKDGVLEDVVAKLEAMKEGK